MTSSTTTFTETVIGSSRVPPVGPSSKSSYLAGPVEINIHVHDGTVEVRTVEFPSREEFSKVLDFSSSLPAAMIRGIIRKYFIPSLFEFVVPRPVDRTCSPPTGFITIFEACLTAGLCFTLPPVFDDLLQRAHLHLGQLMQNSFRQLVCLGVEAHMHDIPLFVDLILKYFQFKQLRGAFYLSPRSGSGVKATTPSKLATSSAESRECVSTNGELRPLKM